ncbi:type II secretion system F family protein [bacterium RCC_150]
MSGLLVFILASTAWMTFQPSRRPGQRVGKALASGRPVRRIRSVFAARRGRVEPLPLTVLVQQLAALLRGGRSPSRLWEELWMVHGEQQEQRGPGNRRLSLGSLQVLAAARAASTMGTSVAEAIRKSSGRNVEGRSRVERRIWGEIAACLEIAESSGCPLAEILTRFAAQLEAEDDAGDARQTALAGPKATVRLLTWLPVFGLGLGIVLGVDAVGILLGNGFGIVALGAGTSLTVAGRIWSARLVHAAADGA